MHIYLFLKSDISKMFTKFVQNNFKTLMPLDGPVLKQKYGHRVQNNTKFRVITYGFSVIYTVIYWYGVLTLNLVF